MAKSEILMHDKIAKNTGIKNPWRSWSRERILQELKDSTDEEDKLKK
jgi:hypothetical protein